MKAIAQAEVGPPDVLELTELDKPVVGDGEVLVRVRAAGANPLRLALHEGPSLHRPAASGVAKAQEPRSLERHRRGS